MSPDEKISGYPLVVTAEPTLLDIPVRAKSLDEEALKRLLRYLADNMWTESRLIQPDPQAHVHLLSLLDFLTRDLGLGEDFVGGIFNQRRAEIEQEKAADGVTK